MEKVEIIPNTFKSIEEFVSGTALLVDKPYGWTSFDALNRIKGFMRKNVIIPPNDHGHDQRFKIGHAGTLDPLATGLLVICTGKLTKQIDNFQGGEKEYTGTIFFGKTTPSYDLETEPEGDYSCDHLTLEILTAATQTMTGEQWQRPPSYSAKHIDGKRAYISARKGIEVTIPPVKVQIPEFRITRFEKQEADFVIRCSKGTYIRTMAHEIGQKLGTGSHLLSLRRTMSYPFRIEDALSMDDVISRLTELSAIKPS